MAKYRFDSIKKGESRRYGPEFDPKKVRGAALKYATSRGEEFRTRYDGVSLYVTRGPFSDKPSDGEFVGGQNFYEFDKYEVGQVRAYVIGQVLRGRKIESLQKVRAAALKYGQRHGIVFKTVIGFEPDTIHIKRFS